VKDRRGKEIRLAAPPKRIVTLGPSVTETVVALGAADRLVGRSKFCTYPPEIQKVPDMGGITDPSLELLLATQPELVISLGFLPERTAQTLEQSGIPVALFDFSTWPQVIESIESINTLLQAQEPPSTLRTTLACLLPEMGQRVFESRGERKLKTLVTLDPDHIYSAGGKSYLGEILRVLGTENAADQATSDWPELSRESVLQFDPERIIVLVGAQDLPAAEKKTATWPKDPFWSQLSAVKNGKVTVLDHWPLIVPGPRLESGIPVLMEALYPSE
jgi:iron complex transport system substrate-binding protein